ncbi:MAG: tetratricopeptide repeat protein [Burkholderiales bacterium]|nr:tetratricopeptide repeat protein [Burkholderiales bacterium]
MRRLRAILALALVGVSLGAPASEHEARLAELARQAIAGQPIAEDELQKLADRGDPAAEHLIGHLHLSGKTVPKNEAQALEWFRRAAAKGYLPSVHAVGVIRERGEGELRDLDEALRHYRRAAEAGYARSQTNLGHMLAEGIGVPQDLEEARRWLESRGAARAAGRVSARHALPRRPRGGARRPAGGGARSPGGRRRRPRRAVSTCAFARHRPGRAEGRGAGAAMAAARGEPAPARRAVPAGGGVFTGAVRARAGSGAGGRVVAAQRPPGSRRSAVRARRRLLRGPRRTEGTPRRRSAGSRRRRATAIPKRCARWRSFAVCASSRRRFRRQKKSRRARTDYSVRATAVCSAAGRGGS